MDWDKKYVPFLGFEFFGNHKLADTICIFFSLAKKYQNFLKPGNETWSIFLGKNFRKHTSQQ